MTKEFYNYDEVSKITGMTVSNLKSLTRVNRMGKVYMKPKIQGGYGGALPTRFSGHQVSLLLTRIRLLHEYRELMKRMAESHRY